MPLERQPGALGIVEEFNVSVPARDGTKLSTNIFRPDAPGRFPALLCRTPYNKGTARHERLVRAGYVVAVQDTRGRYGSEGKFVPFTSDKTYDAQDGFDAVEWLARQPWCDGNVGTFGGAYSAWMQWRLAALRPPHLRAMCAWSIPTTLPALDWPGCYRVARRLQWWVNAIGPDLKRRENGPPPHTVEEALKLWADGEGEKWLWFRPWTALPRRLHGRMADYVLNWYAHPERDPWKFPASHAEITVPNLDFTGYYDHGNDTIGHFLGMRKNGKGDVARQQQKIIIGPWNRATLGARQVGPVDFGPEAQVDLDDLRIRWFDHWLKRVRNGVDEEPPVRYFVMGANRWRNSDDWPPAGARSVAFYLDRQFVLSRNKPGDAPPDEYVYDPADPVPTLWTPELFTVPSDRRRLSHRRDMLRYETPPLERDFECTGHPEAVLYAASSAVDTDFFVRLVDAHPDGLEMDISVGMVRARHRNGLERSELLRPNEVTEFRIRLGPTACRFRAGHRLRVEITSSDFPNYDRNHNTGRDPFNDAEFVVARQAVHHTGRYPSHVVLPVTEMA
jgi:hypothetical protein